MSELPVLTEERDGVLYVTLNRPEKKNAMSLALLVELLAALDKAEASGTIRVVVIRGAEGNFCAGADIKDMNAARALGEGAPKAIYDLSIAVGKMVSRFASSPKTIVTVLEGAVMGGGFGLACVSDVAIASHTVRFALPETTLGLLPAQIAPVLIERIGYSEAKRLSVTGARVPADEALRIGLVHHVTQDMDEAIREVVNAALRCAPEAVAATKKLLWEARFTHSDRMVERAADLFVDAVLGEEGKEGTTAFAEKRRARWMPQS